VDDADALFSRGPQERRPPHRPPRVASSRTRPEEATHSAGRVPARMG
jgi:hypothetical protein